MPRGRGSGPKALVVFPPQWSPQNPHFSLRAIAGHLRANGAEASVRDLNIEFYDRVLTRDYLVATASRIETQKRYLWSQLPLAKALGNVTPAMERDVARQNIWARWHEVHPKELGRIASVIADARSVMRDPERFYHPDTLVAAMSILDRALEIVSLPFYPARISLNDFEQPTCPLTVESLAAHAQDAPNNMFYAFFEEQIPSLLAEQADTVGISINSFSQVLPGLTLARLLKIAAPDLHVSIGGNFFSRLKETLSSLPAFFAEFADSVAFGEGEQTVLNLVRAVYEGTDLALVPNLLVHREGTVVVTPEAEPPQLDVVGVQDLEGLPLELYLTPELVLTIQAGKSCYWGRCTFCDSFVGVKPDTKGIDQLVAEIKHLRDRYGVRHFQFIDEAISPVRLRAMAERFLAEGLDIRWFCNGRLESRFSPDLMELLHEAGLQMILWGFESGSRRIFKLIRKGVSFDKRLEVLRGTAAAGIWNFAYIFFGFPTETFDEALETVDIIRQHTDIIQSYGRSVFTLGKHSPLYADREALGLVDVVEDTQELSTNLSYRDRQGMPDEELREVMEICTSRCAEAYDYGLWFFLRYRENIHLYLSRFGSAWVAQRSMRHLVMPTQQYF